MDIKTNKTKEQPTLDLEGVIGKVAHDLNNALNLLYIVSDYLEDQGDSPVGNNAAAIMSRASGKIRTLSAALSIIVASDEYIDELAKYGPYELCSRQLVRLYDILSDNFESLSFDNDPSELSIIEGTKISIDFWLLECLLISAIEALHSALPSSSKISVYSSICSNSETLTFKLTSDNLIDEQTIFSTGSSIGTVAMQRVSGWGSSAKVKVIMTDPKSIKVLLRLG